MVPLLALFTQLQLLSYKIIHSFLKILQTLREQPYSCSTRQRNITIVRSVLTIFIDTISLQMLLGNHSLILQKRLQNSRARSHYSHYGQVCKWTIATQATAKFQKSF